MFLGHEYYMRLALEEAKAAARMGEIPVGAVVISQGQVIGKGHNLTERLQDVTAHAEMMALTAACNYLGSKYLVNCTLYVTLEPCLMCGGALAWAQLGQLVYGASDARRGYLNIAPQTSHPKTQILGGVLEADCRQLMQDFFREKR